MAVFSCRIAGTYPLDKGPIAMMKSDFFVSVIVPAFNEGARIGRCLDDLLAQDFPRERFEIIVVDNNSTDHTGAVIDRYPVKKIVETRQGRSQARNAGIQAAQGDVIVFIDSDCIPLKSWLSQLVAGFADDSIGCVAGEILPLDPTSSFHQFLARNRYFSQTLTLNHPFLPFAQTGNAAYTREVLDRIGRFDEKLLGEDADLSWRMQLETGKKIAFVEDAAVYHPYPPNYKAYLKQRMRHAYGAVGLYVKYRESMPAKSKKETYWEYRALVKALCRVGVKITANRFAGKKNAVEDDFIQVLGQAAVRCGKILGSIENRVWYL